MSVKETILEAGIALTCEGHAVMGRDDQAPAVRDEAVRGQRLDTPRGVAWHGQRLVASGGIPVRFATLQHKEDRSEDFMPKSDAGSFVAAPYGRDRNFDLNANRVRPAACANSQSRPRM